MKVDSISRLRLKGSILFVLLPLIPLAATLVVGIARKPYDYDEFVRAHSIWMTSKGFRPYDDFFECHPPYFVLLAPFAWLADGNPGLYLTLLRTFSVAGGLSLLGALVFIGWLRGVNIAWSCSVLTLMLALTPALPYFVEFRIDNWAYAVTFWTAAWLITRPRRSITHYLLFGVKTGTVSAILCPKLLMFPLLLGVTDIFFNAHSRMRMLFSLGCGLLLAAVLFLGFLAVQGISFTSAFALLVEYHAIHNSHTAFGRGLLRAVIHQPTALFIVFVSLFVLVSQLAKGRLTLRPFEISAFIWLLLQVGFVAYPYKQYAGPWFLVAAVFPISVGLVRTPLWVARSVWAVMTLTAGVLLFQNGQIWWKQGSINSQLSVARKILELVPLDETLVATASCHPLFRRDATFVWFTTVDPSGFDTDAVLKRIPRFAKVATFPRYLQQLEEQRPALIVIDPTGGRNYPRGLNYALAEHIERHGYQVRQFGDVRLAVRPDLVTRPPHP